MIVAEYTPAALPPGMATSMVGFQVAELSPVIPVAVTAGTAPVRSGGSFAVNSRGAHLCDRPGDVADRGCADRRARRRGEGGGDGARDPAGPAAALRASFTTTWPRAPLIEPPATVLARVPRLPASAGTVIAKAPPVSVNVAVVVSAAKAGAAKQSGSILFGTRTAIHEISPATWPGARSAAAQAWAARTAASSSISRSSRGRSIGSGEAVRLYTGKSRWPQPLSSLSSR